MVDHRQILNSFEANSFYSQQHRFFTNNDPASIKQKKAGSSKRQLQELNARFKKIQVEATRNDRQSEAKYRPETPPFPIDVVFTWVENSADHAKKRKYWLDKTKTDGLVSSDNNTNRWSNHDELRYSIRSIYSHAPWVASIYVIVDDEQFPPWLVDNCADASIPVYIVPHSILYGGQFRTHLPTFNSQSLECHLHRIPNLSEQFIYFNDDMFIGAPAQWYDFFTSDGHPKYTFTGILPSGKKLASMNKHTMAWINNSNLLDKLFADKQSENRKYPAHQACPMLKTSFAEIWDNARIAKYMLRTSQSKFRGPFDLYPIGFLVYWNLYNNRATTDQMSTFYAQMSDQTPIFGIARNIIERKPVLFCINDGLVAKRKSQGRILKEFLKFFFDDATPVEKKIEDHEERQGKEHKVRGTSTRILALASETPLGKPLF